MHVAVYCKSILYLDQRFTNCKSIKTASTYFCYDLFLSGK